MKSTLWEMIESEPYGARGETHQERVIYMGEFTPREVDINKVNVQVEFVRPPMRVGFYAVPREDPEFLAVPMPTGGRLLFRILDIRFGLVYANAMKVRPEMHIVLARVIEESASGDQQQYYALMRGSDFMDMIHWLRGEKIIP